MLAGMKGGTGGATYLNSGTYYWLGSPGNFGDRNAASEFGVNSRILDGYRVNSPFGARGAVSLKPGMKISGGDGSSLTPYEIN